MLVNRHYQRIQHYVCRRGASYHAAQDVTQEVFLKAWHKREAYDPQYAYLAWLYTIARRTSITHHRKVERHQEVKEREPEDTRTPADALNEQDQAVQLWSAARRLLKEDAFLMLWMVYRDGISLKEVAGVMGKSEASIKTAICRSRQTLLKDFEKRQRSVGQTNETANQLLTPEWGAS